jgi:hypothetical protein
MSEELKKLYDELYVVRQKQQVILRESMKENQLLELAKGIGVNIQAHKEIQDLLWRGNQAFLLSQELLIRALIKSLESTDRNKSTKKEE